MFLFRIKNVPSFVQEIGKEKLDKLYKFVNLIDNQLKAQLKLSETRLSNAFKNFHSAPEEVKAAKDAYTQKLVLYKNGLSNIVDFTQALYALNRAEVDNYIAANNVWQALLYKAAASGDFSLFINNF